MFNLLRAASATLISASLFACATDAQHNDNQLVSSAGESFSFVNVSDIPYNDTQKYALNRNITPAIKGFAFVVHGGDIKAGTNSPCTDAEDDAHLAWMERVGVPVFYTPGDNEWTDCDRPSNAPTVRETVRLDIIREKFFNPANVDAPASWKAEWQAGMPENATWRYKGVRFATIHTVAGNNGRKTLGPCPHADGSGCDTQDDIAVGVEIRDRHNLAWISKVFADAKAENAAAVAITTQGDVTQGEAPGKDCASPAEIECDGFKAINDRLASEAAAFGKPVLLMHGDSSPYCWDRSFGGGKAPNLQRLNVAGDYVLIDAVKITYAPNEAFPFVAEGLLSHLEPTEKRC